MGIVPLSYYMDYQGMFIWVLDGSLYVGTDFVSESS